MTAAVKLSTRAPRSEPAGSRFLAIINDEVTREAVRVAAGNLGWPNPRVREGNAEAAREILQSGPAPSFLLVDISDTAEPIAAMEALVEVCDAETVVVAVGMLNDVAFYRRLIEMGVSDYLVKPVSGDALMEAIQNATRATPGAAGGPAPSRLIAMIGARGGVGATTMALSAAWTISQNEQSVVLIDLDLHFGNLALNLDLEPGRGLREMLSNPDRIDSLLIGSAMAGEGGRFRVLGAEEPLEEHLDFTHDGLAALVTDLATNAECIFVDLPRSLGRMTRHLLGDADVIGIVTDRSLPAMRDTQRLVKFVKGMRQEAKIVVIANRVGGVPGEVGEADFERAIGVKIDFSIPFDLKAAAAAAETAKSFSEVARNPKTIAELRQMAFGLVGAEVSAAPPTLLQRILGK